MEPTKGAGGPEFPAVAVSPPASVGMAPLVVWGGLVCLCLKFPDSEFNVRAGLLGGEIVSAQMHACGGFPGRAWVWDRGREGWLVAKYPAWELRSLSPLLAPLPLACSLALPLAH